MATSLLIAAFAAADTPTVTPLGGFFGVLANAAEHFIGAFQAGGTVFVSLVLGSVDPATGDFVLNGIIPLLVVLLTAVNAIVRLIGPERIERFGAMAARPGIQWYPVRYLLLPILAVFFFTNPMAYTMGRFLPERFKPAFYDSAVSFVHPITGLFPHANPAELFVYLGVAAGLTKLNLPLGDLAVRYLLVGMVVIFIRGVLTEFITARLISRAATQEGATV